MSKVINDKIPYFGDDKMACSESTLRLLIERGVIDLPLCAVKMMTGLHGNMNGCGNRYANCGAINGGAAAIGSVYGKCEPGHDSSIVYRLVEEFMSQFETQFGSVKCLDLIAGRSMESIEQQRRCAECVVWAADKIEELLNKEDNLI